MGEATPFRAEFNGSIRIEARSDRLTSDAGVLVLREIFERLGMSEWLEQRLIDRRKKEWITHPLAELLHTAVLLLAQGYRDHDDADALRDEAAFRIAVSKRRGISPLAVPERPEGEPAPKNPDQPEHLASQPTMSRLNARLAEDGNPAVMREAIFECAARRIKAQRRRRFPRVTIDVDSIPVEVHGQQPEAEYNGHYHATVYHPLVASIAETGDLLDLELRRGTAHTAEGGLEFILPLIERAERSICHKADVRFDAGFPSEKTLGPLEDLGRKYLARVKNNAVLNRMAEKHLHRPPGRRPNEPRSWFYEYEYQAKEWSRARRCVLVVLERADDLFLHHFWLITNWTKRELGPEALLEKYRQRGTAEGIQGEFMSVLAPTLSSTVRPKATYQGHAPAVEYPSVDAFAANEVRLLMNALAYNVMHAGRVLVEKATGEGWGLVRFRERVLKVAARVLVHSRRATFVIGRSVAALWGALWRQLGEFAWEPEPGG